MLNGYYFQFLVFSNLMITNYLVCQYFRVLNNIVQYMQNLLRNELLVISIVFSLTNPNNQYIFMRRFDWIQNR